MKTRNIFLTLLSVLLLLGGGCTAEEEIITPSQNENKGNVRFRLGSVASQSSTRGPEAEPNESEVESLYVWLCNADHQEETYVVEAFPTNTQDNEWGLNVEHDGRWITYFIANPEPATIEALKEVKGPEGFNTFATVKGQLAEAVSKQAPDGEHFLMSMLNTTRTIPVSVMAGVADIGTIQLTRHAARFDIVNKAEGITINKVTYKNRARYTHMMTPSSWSVDNEWYDDKVYDNDGAGLEIKGSKDEEATDNKLLHTIYSYCNYSTKDNGQLPELEIEYTEGEGETAVTRTHTVKFIDPNKQNTPLSIKSNNLYTITLVKAHTLDFEVTVSDWENGEEINQTELALNDLDIPQEEQQTLNARLQVNRFAHTLVKEMNITADPKKAVIFSEMTTDRQQYSTNAFYSYAELKKQGFFNTDTNDYLIDINGEAYKIPSAGELSLLIPQNVKFFDKNYSIPKWIGTDGEEKYVTETQMGLGTLQSHLNYYTQSCMAKWSESVEFDTRLEGDKIIPGLPTETSGWKSEIDIYSGMPNKILYYNSDQGYIAEEDKATEYHQMSPLYAVRFKGTSEYAAYKWEMICDNDDPTKLYFSIKIKAIPERLNVGIYDIVDNEKYWMEGYIEYTLPCIGYLTKTGDFSNTSNSQCCILSSCQSVLSINPLCLRASQNYCSVSDVNYAYRYPLLLIKAQEMSQPGE